MRSHCGERKNSIKYGSDRDTLQFIGGLLAAVVSYIPITNKHMIDFSTILLKILVDMKNSREKIFQIFQDFPNNQLEPKGPQTKRRFARHFSHFWRYVFGNTKKMEKTYNLKGRL